MIISCSSTKSKEKPVVLYGKVEFNGDPTPLNPQKFDAAMSILMKLSNRYNYISLNYLINKSLDNPEYANKKVNEIAQEYDADYIAIAQVNILKHIIRSQITLKSTDKSKPDLIGSGFDNLKYTDASTGDLIYDPALLRSLQRAYASAIADSNHFVIDSLKLNVKPLPTLVIGPIAFSGENQDDWKLYLDKVVSSYAAVETVFDILKFSNNYVVYDTETRDSVYKIFGFHIAENYSPPTMHEIKALYQMAVDYYVSGNLHKTDKGAELSLSLYSITQEGLLPLKTEEQFFDDDSRMVFLEHIIRAAVKLFNIEEFTIPDANETETE
ncbi:MAG: hypothetical protein KIT33_11060 [Candidatus Kapabacteria bacterium]|nr:hypothetical protein [Ignavibacteriota bacterium]MCW5885496.1 hypothetical protein [Candidatus Kapabacteria bacterium]